MTVLVVDAVSSTDSIAAVDPDDAEQMVDDVLNHIRGAVETAGGLLVSFAGDGGVAVFGWPDSLEDHADRACEAAWNIQHNRMDEKPVLDPAHKTVQFRVGVHSGLVGLRQLQLERGSQLDLVGGTVHLAARLEKAAGPGEILISADTRELCQLEFHHRDRTDLPILEEIGSSVMEMGSPPLRNQAHRQLPSYPHPMVGRQEQMQVVLDALFKPEGAHETVAIVGEPGIGKSRLAHAVVEQARTRDLSNELLVFHGDIQKRSTPFALPRALILNALQLGETANHEAIATALERAGIDEFIPALLGISSIQQDQAIRHSEGSDLTIRQMAQLLVDALYHTAVDSRALLLVEDLHLVDPESQMCLELMKSAPAGKHLAVLITGRPEAAYDAREVADNYIRLEPLPRAQMLELAHQLFENDMPSAQYLERALDQADGIPFVLEQLACSIGSDADRNDPEIPQSVQSMIHARINRLPAETKYYAQGLSVLGEEVELAFAAEVLNLNPAELSDAVTDLEKLAVTHPAEAGSVRFRHAIIANVCANSVPRARRESVHRAAIDTIRNSHTDLGGQYERLAFHAEEAGDDAAALEFLYQACIRAARSAAGRSLLLNFERALTCINRIGEPAEETFVTLVQMVCAPLLQHGEFSQMQNHLPRTLELANKQGHKGRICAALSHIGTVAWFDGRYQEGMDSAQKALDIAQEIDSLPHIFAAQHLLSVLNHSVGNVDRALELQNELCALLTGDLETARLGSAGIPAAISNAFMGWFLTETGHHEESQKRAQSALEISLRCGNSYSEGISLNALGRNLLMMGRHREAIECLRSALALVERHGYDAPRPHVAGLLATALSRGGHAEEALELAEKCFDSAAHLRTGRLEIFYLYAGYAEALFRTGAVERSFPAADQAVEIARGINNPSLISQGLALRAQLRSELNPDSPLLARDLEEHRALCVKHGLKQIV